MVAGHPRVVLIPGDAGLGKTRLLQEVRAEAEQHGMHVYFGRSSEELGFPYLPFVKVLSLLWEQFPKDVQLGADADIIVRFLHQDKRMTSTVNLPLSAQSDHDKLQLFFAVSRTIIKRAQHSPSLVAIDDLHWADPPSLDLLGNLVYAVADAALQEPIPLLIVGVYRPVEPLARLARLIARLQREPICHTLELSGFDEAELYALLQGLGLTRPSHQLVATIREATQGNPLFIQEVVHHLTQQGDLQDRGGYVVTTTPAADLRLPTHVTEAILARTQGLSDPCRQALTLAAFLGESFSLRSLGAVSALDEDTLLQLLEEGMRQGVLLSEGTGFQFAHALIQRVFYNEPSVARRQRLHQQLAERLEQYYADALDEHVLEIAHHLARASVMAIPEKAAAYTRRAGDIAFNAFSWEESAQYYEASLLALKTAKQSSLQIEAELHHWAGIARHRDQDVGPCLDHYDKAIERYQLTNDLRGLAQVLMEKVEIHYTLAPVPFGTMVDTQPLIDVLMTLGDADLDIRGRIAATMAEAYRYARQTDKSKTMAYQALEIGQHLKDDRLCAHAHSVLALSHIQGMQVKEALEGWRSALAAAQRAGDMRLQGWPLQRLPLALHVLGHLDEATSLALEGCALTRQTQDWGEHSLALSHLASLAAAKGDFADVERHAHASMLMMRRSGYPWGSARAQQALACAHMLRGAWDDATAALHLLLDPDGLFQKTGPVIAASARVFRQLVMMHASACDDAPDAAVEELMKIIGNDTYSLAPLCAVIELGRLAARPELAQQAYQKLIKLSERDVLFSSGWLFLLPRVLGVAATLNKQWDEAETYFRAALDVTHSHGNSPEIGRTYLDYALMLSARNHAGDLTHAITLLNKAIGIFEDLGMTPFMQQAKILCQDLQINHAPAPPSSHFSSQGIEEAEIDIFLRIAQERTHLLG